MATKVQCKSFLPGYYSMREHNEDANGGSWPLYYGDKSLSNGQYCNGFLPRAMADAYLGYDMDALKRTMIEHEAVFKNQVYELHRLYRIQRDMMDEIKRTERHKHHTLVETSSSSSPYAPQMPSEDSRKWHIPSLPVCARTPISGSENTHSPMSFMKQNPTTQAGPIGSSKDFEALESRPTKVRRKMFDLHLPADEYIDTEEEVGKASFSINALRTDSCVRSTKGLADLNEPIDIEETGAPASVNSSAEPKSQFPAFTKEILHNSQRGIANGSLNNLYVENRGNGRDWFSPYMIESGHNKNNLKPIPLALQPEKPHIPSQPAQEPNAFPPIDHQSKGDILRDRTVCGLEISDRNQSYSNHNHSPNPYPFISSSDLANSWSHSSSGLSRKSSQSSAQSQGILGDKWHHLNGTCRPNPGQGHGNGSSNRNGFYLGSSSGCKDLAGRYPYVGFDYLNCGNEDKSKYSKGSAIPLLLKSSCNEIKESAALPWFRAKPVCETEVTNLRRDSDSVKLSFLQAISQIPNEICTRVEATRIETNDVSPSNTKILGVSIFGKPCASKAVENNGRKGVIDINVACDSIAQEVLVVEKGTDSKLVGLRDFIDLNSCVSDDEASLVPSVRTKVAFEIDLEAPMVSETEENLDELPLQSPEDKAEELLDELITIAADVIVAISSCNHFDQSEGATWHPPEASSADTLHWFADVASCIEDPERDGNYNRETSSNDIDYFEAMTLQLEETKMEDYLPDPLENAEEMGPALVLSRTRKGARRGRQRRDFQRDILPGLASLSRHEVTEDLQMFGGLMRATGYSWQSGLARRNGSGRGRRRRSFGCTASAAIEVVATTPICVTLMEQLNNIELGLEDRSLTGWGKKTRRPRRQRCPAGNPPAPLT